MMKSPAQRQPAGEDNTVLINVSKHSLAQPPPARGDQPISGRESYRARELTLELLAVCSRDGNLPGPQGVGGGNQGTVPGRPTDGQNVYS
ncbi:hypothetical protein PoB_002870200 [Plakobranchus ocellatus]|uniref:Uncharacterized protein n=1 Tax=Plakobranchus ocellatus TaxID=259542 RepID=A0AAV4A4J2_9GAST|nr:hypothetical protein PoB_002870200 [Plakobranchus ocellatus]